MTGLKLSRKAELDFYVLYLKNYLTQYRFDDVTDTFIQARAELAQFTYTQLRRMGAAVDAAHEMSMDVLLEGFRYSEHEILMDVLEEEFADDISEDYRPYFVKHLQSLRQIEDVFADYDMQANTFINSGRYHMLRCELTGMISIILTEYGL